MARVRESWASSEATRRSMLANRSRDTRPELAVRRAAHALGLRYRVAARPLPKARRTADLVFRRARVAVFIDGCWWHGCPEHFRPPVTRSDYWIAKIDRNRARDKQIDALLAAEGWLVVRVWEHEDAVAAVERIARYVRTRTAS
jgi:DNA mismatch endonuclease (patch repair protein)